MLRSDINLNSHIPVKKSVHIVFYTFKMFRLNKTILLKQETSKKHKKRLNYLLWQNAKFRLAIKLLYIE